MSSSPSRCKLQDTANIAKDYLSSSNRTSVANAVIVSRRKKKSHLSRDELARVCHEGEVAFESYNGSSYMVAVRSLGDRKSLIGYRCDWNACGYMNARVERMFGHIRSQHPEAPAVKKLISTTGSGSTSTISTIMSPSGSGDMFTTTTTTCTRLSIRSSSSLSSSSSSNSCLQAYSPGESQHHPPPVAHLEHHYTNHPADVACSMSVSQSSPASAPLGENEPKLNMSAQSSSSSSSSSSQQSNHVHQSNQCKVLNDPLKKCGNNRLIDLLKRCDKPSESNTQAQTHPTAEQIMAELKTISTQPNPASTVSNAQTGTATNFGAIDRNNNRPARDIDTVEQSASLPQHSRNGEDILDLESLLSSNSSTSLSSSSMSMSNVNQDSVNTTEALQPSPYSIDAQGHYEASTKVHANCYATPETLEAPSGAYSQHFAMDSNACAYPGYVNCAPSQAPSVINDYCLDETTLSLKASNHDRSTQHQTDKSMDGEPEAQPAKKKTSSSKNYIGKQNLFQEFLNEDVAKVRDSENRYIIALQKEAKIVGYRCDWPECEFLTCRKYVMVNHINGKHTNQRPFPCPMCSFSFVKRYFLKAHLHKVHKQDMDEEKDIDEIDEIEAIKRNNRLNYEENSLDKDDHHRGHHHKRIKKDLGQRHQSSHRPEPSMPQQHFPAASSVPMTPNEYFGNDPAFMNSPSSNGYPVCGNSASYACEANSYPRTSFPYNNTNNFYEPIETLGYGTDSTGFNGGVPCPTTPGSKAYGEVSYDGQFGDCYSPSYNSPQSQRVYGNFPKTMVNGTSPQGASSIDMLTPPHSMRAHSLPCGNGTASSVPISDAYAADPNGLCNFIDHNLAGFPGPGSRSGDEFLSPPSSISSNGSTGVSGLPTPNISDAGNNNALARGGNRGNFNSMVASSSFYLHTPSPSPSSATHSPAGGTSSHASLSLNATTTNANYFDPSVDYQWQSPGGGYYGQQQTKPCQAASLQSSVPSEFGGDLIGAPGGAYCTSGQSYGAGNAGFGDANGYETYGQTTTGTAYASGGEWNASATAGW